MDLIKAFLHRGGPSQPDSVEREESKITAMDETEKTTAIRGTQSEQLQATTTPTRSSGRRTTSPKKPMTWETRDKRIQNPIFALADIKDPEGEVLRPTTEQMRLRLQEEKLPFPRHLEFDPCYLSDPNELPEEMLAKLPPDISAKPFKPITPPNDSRGKVPASSMRSVLLNSLSFQALIRAQDGSTWAAWREADLAARYGHLDLLQWKEGQRQRAEAAAAGGGGGGGGGSFVRYSRRVLEWGAESGNLALVEWLVRHKHRYTWPFAKEAMTAACRGNHYRMVEWLHWRVLVPAARERARHPTNPREVKEQQVSKDAMNVACKNGNWRIVLFLHKHRNEGCGLNAMDDAARNGHLDLVRWLHFHGYRCSNYAMNNAALNGHLEIFEWLHLNRREGCSHYASMYAAQNNHLGVLEWMYRHLRGHVNTRDTINFAAR